jgi:hypothetical protein
MFKEPSFFKVYNEKEEETSVVKNTLEDLGLLGKVNEDIVFDAQKYKEIINNPDGFSKEISTKLKSLSLGDLLEYFKDIKVKDLNNIDGPEVNALSLPENIEDAKEGKFKDGLLYPWDLKKIMSLNDKLKINDEEEIGIIELCYLKKINELQFHRNENDELAYYDKESNDFIKFSPKKARQIFERNVSFNEKVNNKRRTVGLNVHGDYFINQYLPVIKSLELFKAKDFERDPGVDVNLYAVDTLKELNLLKTENGETLFNAEEFKNIYKNKDNYDPEQIKKLRKISFKDILNFFKDLKVVDPNSLDRAQINALSLPTNIDDAKKGKFEEGLLAPWELKEIIPLNYSISLDGKEEVKIIELYYLKKINELQFHRNENDELVYFDNSVNDFAVFKPVDAEEIFGRNGTYIKDGNAFGFQQNGFSFVSNFLPLVNDLGLFKDKDFQRRSNSFQADIMFSRERELNEKNQYLLVTSGKNLQARYYLGRDKIVGTKVEKNKGNLSAVEMDAGTMGILEKKYGKSRLLFEFKKLTEQEFEERGFDKINEKHRHVKSEEMKERLKEYKVANYLPQRPNESVNNYANRLSNLNDVNFVVNTFRGFMAQTNVNLSQLSWAEQLLISNYILETNNEKDLINFVKKYQENGLRAFLAAEVNLDLADKIIKLDEKIPHDQASMVFAKISEINLLALKKSQDLSQLFFSDVAGNDKELLAQNIYKHLFNKSIDIVNQLDAGQDSKKSSLINKLKEQKVEIILLSLLLKEAKEQKIDLNIEDIKNLNLDIKDLGSELEDKDRNSMINIAQENWQQFGNSKLADIVLTNFRESLKDTSSQRYYVLKLKDEIVSFVRFELLGDNALYAGSFNVARDLRGINIGNKMMEKALIFESQKNILKASASIKIPAASNYIENVGFVADGIINNYNDSNESMFNIVLDRKMNSQYKFRNEEKTEAIDCNYLKSLALNNNSEYKKHIGDSSIVLKFDLKTEFNKYQESLGALLARTDEKGNKLESIKGKYTLTRFFKDKDDVNGDIRYLVFELNN